MVPLMKKICAVALLLCVTAVSATAQTITAKCKTCGKPIAACPYKGRHPAAAPGKKPARQQPARRPGGHSGATRPTQSQGVSGSSTRPQTTRPAVSPEKANLLNLVAKPFGVVENVSRNTTPQQVRDAVSQMLGLELKKVEGTYYLNSGIKHNLCGLPVDWEEVYFSHGKLDAYKYGTTVLKSNTSKEEMINTARRMAAMLGLVEKWSGGLLQMQTEREISYFENEEDPIIILTVNEGTTHEKLDSYCITLDINYRL